MLLMDQQRLSPKLTGLIGLLILILSLSGTAFSGGIKNAYKLSPVWLLEGEEVWAGGAFAYANQVVYGPMAEDLVGELWGNGTTRMDGAFWTDYISIWAEALFSRRGVFWTDRYGTRPSSSVSQGVFWTDSSLEVDYFVALNAGNDDSRPFHFVYRSSYQTGSSGG